MATKTKEKETTIMVHPSTKRLIESLMVGHESYEGCIVRLLSKIKKESQ